MTDDLARIGQEMYSYIQRLFPICRSLTGRGVRDSLAILREIAPLHLHEVPSGTRVFDWTVPPEWTVRDAYIADESGERIVDFKKNNLHLVGYSEPFHGKLNLSDLQKHLHSLPERPEAIPYVTSYYARRWGFCLSHRQREQLTEQTYTVKVDTKLGPGSMTIADLVIPGVSEEEIVFSTYHCHPSMANNELSGPVLAAFLAHELIQRPHHHYTYRFIFVPETIGAITYLSRHLNVLKKNVKAGYVITCVGDPGDFSYLETRLGDATVDKVTAHVLKHSAPSYRRYNWLERGSDERHYCWPGVDLPIGSLMRTKYGEYPEYHTSEDNLDFVTPEAMAGSYAMYLRCIEALEGNRLYRSKTLGEPQLGRYGLYPTLSTRKSGITARDLVNILAYSDGNHDLIAIADKIGKAVWELYPLVRQAVEAKLLEEVGHGSRRS